MGASALQIFMQGNYQALLEMEGRPADDLAKYLQIRAAILLGEYERASRQLSRDRWGHDFYGKFLKCQLDIYRRTNTAEQPDELLALVVDVSEPRDLVLGEYHFVFGHLCQILDQSLSGCRHHRRAIDHYFAAGCHVAAAHALYNLSIAYKHLNRREDFERTRLRLTSVAASHPNARIPLLRLEINLAIDFEEFEHALSLLSQLEDLVLEAGRRRDLGSVTCQRIYALMCLDREEQALALCARDLPTHSAVICEYRRLIKLPLVTPGQAYQLARDWKRIESIFRLCLLRLLLERLVRSEEFDCVLAMSKAARKLSQKKQQAPSLVDHQYYEILALLRTSHFAAARALFSIYKNQAVAWDAAGRLKKASALQRYFGPSGSSGLVLDPARQELIIGGVKHDLSRKPLMMRFLLNVCQEDALSLGALHLRLYHCEYEPFLHERKMHSLLDRARRELGLGTHLQRQDGKIRIVGIKTCVTRAPSKSGAVESRREALIEKIRSSGGAVSISDLENSMEFGRRTIQLDLKHLARTGRIVIQGKTRGRHYMLGRAP